MPNVINEMIVRELSSSFADAEGMLIVSMSGLTVAETETLRESLAENGVRLRMVRNRLARIAMRERGLEFPGDALVGNIAMAWGSPEDAIHAAKVLARSDAKKDGRVVLRAGFLDGAVLGPDETNALAELPGRDELRARIVGAIAGPARSLVGILAAPSSSLARVLQARADQLAEGGASET